MTRFAELAAATNFSFLRGASHPEEMVAQARAIGLAGVGIADRNSLAGVVRAWSYRRDNIPADEPFRVVVGARLVFADGTPDVLAYPVDRGGYGRLTRLLTLGNRRAAKGDCRLVLPDLLAGSDGLQLILCEGSGRGGEPPSPEDWAPLVAALREAAPDRVWLAATQLYGPAHRRSLAERAALSRLTGAPLLATNAPLMHHPDRRPLADVVACIREGLSLDAMGRRLDAHAERHLKPAAEMARIFAEAPEAVGETLRFLAGIAFDLSQLKYNYPDELRDGYATEREALEAYAEAGLAELYPLGAPAKVRAQLDSELAIVAQLGYWAYFLTVHDIVRHARSLGILCQGRGSAANSVLCYALGITSVDPVHHDLLFERFLSVERREPPDIDVDFEHERREEVIQYIYRRYGRERAALAASVVTYRTRSAVREVGRAFGLSDDAVAALNGTVWGYWSKGIDPGEAKRIGFDPGERRLAQVLRLAEELSGFPRHLSQHTGGFVITRSRLDDAVPILNAAMAERTTVEWDKDDLDAVGMLKVDVLALGILSALQRGFDLIDRHYGERYRLATVPGEDEAVYRMISRADTMGVFQIESRAQMSMLPRLRPREFYDLVVEVAIVRPGPIQGDMVHPYLRRREGSEAVTYPSAELEAVLGKTMGVPLFQEQAMRIAIVAAGFTPSEADGLRRAMATFKRVDLVGRFRDKMIGGMVERKYDLAFAERCFAQIEGFGTYGFPESHAAAFALLVYASAWMKCRYPDAFACALLNSQPMGFYAPAQLVGDARDHGVAVHEVDVNFSGWDHALVPLGSQHDGTGARLHPKHADMRDDVFGDRAIRLGLRLVKGLREAEMERLVERRGAGYDSVRDLWLRAELSPAALEVLAEADAFRSLGLDRRAALWAVRGLDRAGGEDALPLFTTSPGGLEPAVALPPLRLGEHVIEDYRRLRLSLKAHPVSFLRGGLTRRGLERAGELGGRGRRGAAVAGLVLVRQRPGSAHGTIFLTLEDETGPANVIVWPKVFEANRPAVIAARLLGVWGSVQEASGVVHLVAERLEDLSAELDALGREPLDGTPHADELKKPQTHETKARRSGRDLAAGIRPPDALPPAREPAPFAAGGARRAMPKGRNFH
ncbi:error-prone DNA polymerase [Lichenibacterium dinghuense]|uniref:error-prone DNA polymerase n=1 Tax=Lichenibacterium dinghuense TaxID=2895977 RepID=UPI001F01A156|nr:error-prone DNA polymerase [Lichenibacterium sp. 6Y81]